MVQTPNSKYPYTKKDDKVHRSHMSTEVAPMEEII